MNSLIMHSNPILSFLYDFDLLEGVVIFDAELDFICNSKRKITKGEVQVNFDEKDGHALIRISKIISNEMSLPVILDSRIHDFTYIPGVTLQVNGTDHDPLIGKFKVSIFPVTVKFSFA